MDRWDDLDLDYRNSMLNVASLAAEADAEYARIQAKKRRKPNQGLIGGAKAPPGAKPG